MLQGIKQKEKKPRKNGLRLKKTKQNDIDVDLFGSCDTFAGSSLARIQDSGNWWNSLRENQHYCDKKVAKTKNL